MKRETLFLKVTVFLIGLPILGVCIFLLNWMVKEGPKNNLDMVYYPVLIGLIVTAIPFFVALYQTLKLLSFIDHNNAFSELSVRALKNIKYCAFTISIMYAVGLPFFFNAAQADDAPGVVLIGLVKTSASLVIGVFAAVLQKLLRNAIDIKIENDLTV